MKPICIFVSDLHLYDEPPICRCGEPNWIEKQLFYLDELQMEQTECECPIIIAGDIFHKWFGCSKYKDSSFINHILDKFASFKYPIYSICGNHDLPHHNIELVGKSAYKTLTTGIIKDFSNKWIVFDDVAFYGYPFNSDLKIPKYMKAKEHVAVVHKLIWKNEPFPGAPESGNVESLAKTLCNFNVIVAGDNHDGFIHSLKGVKKKQTIINCGSMMRTSTIQKEYKPMFYVYYGNHKIETCYFSIDSDVFSEDHIVDVKAKVSNMEIFSKLLEIKTKNQSKGIPTFDDNVKKYMGSGIVKETKELLETVLIEAEHE